MCLFRKRKQFSKPVRYIIDSSLKNRSAFRSSYKGLRGVSLRPRYRLLGWRRELRPDQPSEGEKQHLQPDRQA